MSGRSCPREQPRRHATQRARSMIFKLSRKSRLTNLKATRWSPAIALRESQASGARSPVHAGPSPRRGHGGVQNGSCCGGAAGCGDGDAGTEGKSRWAETGPASRRRLGRSSRLGFRRRGTGVPGPRARRTARRRHTEPAGCCGQGLGVTLVPNLRSNHCRFIPSRMVLWLGPATVSPPAPASAGTVTDRDGVCSGASGFRNLK